MSLFRFAVIICLAAGAAQTASAQPVTVPAPVEKLHLADGECEAYDEAHMREARVAAKLDANRTFYLLPCFTGAYNVISRAYAWDPRYPDDAQGFLFAAFSDQLGWYGRSGLINADFDTTTGTLTAFEKGRGLGDCGSQPLWRWTEYGWRLIEYRHWEKCDGSRMPKEWPVIYSFSPPK